MHPHQRTIVTEFAAALAKAADANGHVVISLEPDLGKTERIIQCQPQMVDEIYMIAEPRPSYLEKRDRRTGAAQAKRASKARKGKR